MKKTILYISIIISALVLSINIAEAQKNKNTSNFIESFTFRSFKDYSNNVRVAYFEINGIQDNKERLFVESELKKHADVFRFFIYAKKNNLNNCMIETKSSINESILKKMINDIIFNSRNLQK